MDIIIIIETPVMQHYDFQNAIKIVDNVMRQLYNIRWEYGLQTPSLVFNYPCEIFVIQLEIIVVSS